MHDFEWTEELEKEAKIILEGNPDFMQDQKMKDNLETQGKSWEKFYKFNKTNFFKDRHYILKEFPELKDDSRVNKIEIIKNIYFMPNNFIIFLKNLIYACKMF